MKISDVYENLPALDAGKQNERYIPGDVVASYFDAVGTAYGSVYPPLKPLEDMPTRQWNSPVVTDGQGDRFEVSLIRRDGLRFARFLAQASLDRVVIVEGVMMESDGVLDYAAGRVKNAQGEDRSLAFSTASLAYLTSFIMKKSARREFSVQRATRLDKQYRRDFKEALESV